MRNNHLQFTKQIGRKVWLLLALFLVSGSYLSAQITLTATSGTLTGSYTTFKDAIDAINIGTHQGDVVIKVHSNTTETASARLDSSGVVSGAIYSSVTIMPADTATVAKVISLGVSAAVVFDMNGADNVIIDGRPLGAGTQRLLTFTHTNPDLSAASMVLRVINGGTNISIRYINSVSTTSSTTGFACPNISISTSAATTGNKNIVINNNSLTGGVYSCNIVGTAANAMDSITVSNNVFTDFRARGVVVAAVKNAWVENNVLQHTGVLSGWNVYGMLLEVSVNGAVYNVHRNRIVNLGTANTTVQLMGAIINPTVAAPAVIPAVNFTNNYIGLITNNTAPSTFYGLLFQGSTPANVNINHNTIRMGGNGTSTTGNPASIGVVKTNSSTTSSFTFLNNICINTRTGTANQHVGYFNTSPTVGINISDYNTFAGRPVGAMAWGGFFYGNEIDMKSATFPNEQHSVIGAVTFNNTTSPDLAPGQSSRLFGALPLAAVTSDIYGTARSTNAPYRGAYESATLLDTMEAAVVAIYTYGKIPVGTDDTVRVVLRNMGAKRITGLNVRLTGTASNFEDSVKVDLPVGLDTIVSLSPYNPSVLGPDTLRVTITNDLTPADNMMSWLRENTLNALTYTQTSLPRFGNVGTNPEGEIVAKFYTPVPNFVNQVNVNFTNPAFVSRDFQVVIYEDSGSTFGPKRAPLWVSATQSTTNGVVNIQIPSIAVAGSFYIGVRQTTPNNIGFAYQQEIPIRTKTFYFRQGSGTSYQNLAWNDFAIVSTNTFRFMIEPRLKINNDVGVIDLVAPGTGCANLGVQPVKVKIQNLGLLPQNFAFDNLSLYGFVRKPSGTVYNFGPVSVNSGSLLSDGEMDVDLTSNFDFDSSGVYTFKAWTVFGPDNNQVNDTLPELQRNILVANSIPYTQTFNAGTAIPTGWTSGRFVVTAGSGRAGSNGARVNLFNTTPFSANALLQSPRVNNITATTALRFDYRILNNVGGTAATLSVTDSIKVMVSTDCGNTFTMVGLINGTNHVPSLDFNTHQVDLGAYVGSDVVVKLLFDWFGTTNDAIIDLDNIRIVEASYDVAISGISAPCRSVIVNSAAFSPEVTVTNPGLLSPSSFDVNVSITGPATYIGSFTIPGLNSGSSVTVNMSGAFNPTVAGKYTLKAWTSLSGDGDVNNDTLVTVFNVTDLSLGNSPVNSLTFGGPQSRVNVANAPTLNVAGGITLEAWISRNATAATRTILAKDSAVGFIQYALELNDTNALKFTVFTTAGFNVFTSTKVVPTGYHHVAATFDGTSAFLYIDGELVGSTSVTTGTIIPFDYDVHIGNNSVYSTSFGGAIDELKVWSIARTANDIRTGLHTRMANAASPDLMAYFRMDETSADSFITDASGNCNAGIITGMFAAALPTRTAALYPLATPSVANHVVTVDGYQYFTGTDVVMYFSGFTGEDSIYVHKFTSAPLGTSPAGVAAVYPNYWMVYKYGTGTFSNTSSTIEFTLANGSLASGVVNTDLKFFNRAAGSTGAWTMVNASAVNASFSLQTVQFTLADTMFNKAQSIGGNNNPLPVQLLKFSASASKADAVLHWSTASETNNKGFMIERSLDGKTFTEVEFVKGAGSSNNVNTYSYADRNIFATASAVYYRLKQVDYNEAYTYTDVVLVRVSDVAKPQVVAYPNPVRDVLSVEVDALSAGSAIVTLTDITGKLVKSVNMILVEGFNKLDISELNTLKTGIYLININADGRSLYQDKLVKTE